MPLYQNTTPGGSLGAVQYNNAGAFGGFGSWDGTTLTVPGIASLYGGVLGAGASTRLRVFDFSYTDSHIGNSNNGLIYADITVSPAGGVDVTKAGGIDVTYSTDPAYTGTITYANPLFVAFYGEGTNNATHVTGSNSDLELNGTGIWGDAANYRVDMYNNGTVTTWRGIYFVSYGNDGTIGTYEGIRVVSPGGAITNNYGIRIDSMSNVTGSPTVNHPFDYAGVTYLDVNGKLTVPAAGLTIGTSLVTLGGNFTTTGAFNGTFAIPSSSTWTFPSGGGTLATLAGTETFTNKRITKRVVTASDATSITPNSDSADITYQANTQAAGTLTINADGGTPTNGQSWVLKVKCTNAQTLSWNSIFVGGTVALPTATTGSSKIDYFCFLYDSVTPKWDYTGTAVGF